MIHWVLWKLERDLARCSIAAMTLGPGQPGRMSVAEWLPSDGRHQEAIALAIDAKLLHEVMLDGSSTWIDTVVRPKSDPVIGVTELSLPIGPGRAEQPSRPTAVFDFLSIVHRLRASPFRDAASRRLDWREEAIPWRPRSHEIVRNALMGAPAYPWVRGGARRVGFILPLLEFGGVEKVALNIARGLRAHGWEPHLFLVEAQSAAITPEWSTAFASIGFLADAEFRAWGGGENDYLGTNIPGWAAAGQHQAALGMLYWLDAVISFHAAAVAGLMGKLRRLGVRTAISLHLSDRTAYGRPVGNTYLGLAFEHAYDLFLPCSHQLADWCNAMGVPRDKIVPVQNAPGFDLPPAQVDAAYMDRVARQPGEPLRVLYLGRLDRQKGIERLADVMRESDARRLNLAWRVIGKAVIDDGQAAVAPEIAAVLEPPLLTPAELARAYNWADVMVLLSHYEGLPLTILEAMRAGTVVLATDVGAVREVLRHRENGFVLAPARAASDCVDALAALAADRDLLRQLSARAYEGRRGYDWVEATRELVAKL
jgi:glycosyltransferase involved in cell wall biosynthesis